MTTTDRDDHDLYCPECRAEAEDAWRRYCESFDEDDDTDPRTDSEMED
jgi:hypothetical protein